MERKSSEERILNFSRTGAVKIESGHGRGVGSSPAGAADARQLARESAERALAVQRATR